MLLFCSSNSLPVFMFFGLLIYQFSTTNARCAGQLWRAVPADATATTEIVNKHRATWGDWKRRCNYVLSIGFFLCVCEFFLHHQRVRHSRFAPALLAFCFGQLAVGRHKRTRTRMRHDVSVVMVMRSMAKRKRRTHSKRSLSENSIHNYGKQHRVWHIWVACNPFFCWLAAAG